MTHVFGETRAETAKTMAYSESLRLSKQLQTVKTVADCRDSFIFSRQLQSISQSFSQPVS